MQVTWMYLQSIMLSIRGHKQKVTYCVILFIWHSRKGKIVQFSHSVISDSLWPHGLQHTRPPCPSPTPGAYSNSCPSHWWCHPTISSSVFPFSSHLQSFPVSGSFPVTQFFASGGQSTGVSRANLTYRMILLGKAKLQGWETHQGLGARGQKEMVSGERTDYKEKQGNSVRGWKQYRFDCGSSYTMAYICQYLQNCMPEKGWILLDVYYTSINLT